MVLASHEVMEYAQQQGLICRPLGGKVDREKFEVDAHLSRSEIGYKIAGFYDKIGWRISGNDSNAGAGITFIRKGKERLEIQVAGNISSAHFIVDAPRISASKKQGAPHTKVWGL